MGESDTDLDRLVEDLERAVERTPAGAATGLETLLRLLAERGASDLILVAGEPPVCRVDGRVGRCEGAVLDGEDIEAIVLPALSARVRQTYASVGIADASFALAGVGRFRLNLHHQRGRAAANVRLLPTRVPGLAALHLPATAERLARIPHGLVLIGGATGSGKTTTLAALVGEINRRDAKHIVTIEDPIEYEHRNQKSVIQQVEIGTDAPDFRSALRSALRQHPDVLVIGEMRDPETMQVALAAGETGHLVFSTLHTTDLPSTVARIADSFPAERQSSIRQEMAAALSAVFVQTLLPLTGGGRIPAAELLMVGYGARQHIRRNALQHLHQEITITRKAGSISMEECLADLVKRGLVERGDAAVRANHPADFEHALQVT